MNRAVAVRSDPLSLEEQKRLGQFFTGRRLARLLAALGEVPDGGRVIDPMAGSGDMLEAVCELSSPQLVAGIEIDPTPLEECARRVAISASRLHLAVGDAFSASTWAGIPDGAWDLVITNPPYVRYQRGARPGTGRVHTPSAQQVRSGLIELLDHRLELPASDRAVFGHLARSFSGLADLAVPAWILCAALVRPGGRLAMVVPDTWLTRDYALPVLYVLTRFFDIESIVEDGDASWFQDALVRTTLVVARRVPDRRTSGRAPSDHAHVRLGPAAADATALVGSAFPDVADAETAFARLVRDARAGGSLLSLPGIQAEIVPGTYFGDVIARRSPRARWYSALEDVQLSGDVAPHVPRQALRLVERRTPALVTPDSYGWKVGQGLRTGANRFFYGTLIEEGATEAVVTVDPIIRAEPLPVPRDALRPVIRGQHDVGRGESTRGRLFELSNYVLPEDAQSLERSLGVCRYSVMPEPLAGYVRAAAAVNLSTNGTPRFIPELSAVATNVRLPDPERPGRFPRFWYQLPALASRHEPDVFLPRVNYASPVPVINAERVVVDANFSTMWRTRADALDPATLAALMRSTWVRIVLEASGTVLGAGALKVEATHLRRLALPSVSEDTAAALGALGGRVQDGSDEAEVVAEVDRLVWGTLGVQSVAAGEDLLVELLGRRSRREARPSA